MGNRKKTVHLSFPQIQTPAHTSTSEEGRFAQTMPVGYHDVCTLFPNPAAKC
jgi:hypothetical protein